MRVTGLRVHGLFGMFNHSINFMLKDRITIIHGPNGLGKTTVLLMLHYFLSGNFLSLSRVQFRLLEVLLDDESTISINREGIESKKSPNDLSIIRIPKAGRKSSVYKPLSDLSKDRMRRQYMREVQYRKELEINEINASEERLAEIEYYKHFFEDASRNFEDREPNWYKDLRKEVHSRYIQTQRLLEEREIHSVRNRRPETVLRQSVANFSQELKLAIQSKLTEYAEESQALDRSFPVRLLKTILPEETNRDWISYNLIDVDKKRNRIIKAGILESSNVETMIPAADIDDSDFRVLYVYLKDTFQKLNKLEEITDKIELLKQIVNSRFLYKSLEISKDDGFVFRDARKRVIDIDGLSSGEQHQLVLLYLMLFKTNKNDIVLIDEPELSLHVAWQEAFLQDIQSITKIVEFDTVISTHSPQIVYDRWDLTVRLSGPKQLNPHPGNVDNG